MLGKRSEQRGLFEADPLYLDLVGRDSFYGRLAGLWGSCFGMRTSRPSTAETMAGAACRPACWLPLCCCRRMTR